MNIYIQYSIQSNLSTPVYKNTYSSYNADVLVESCVTSVVPRGIIDSSFSVYPLHTSPYGHLCVTRMPYLNVA